MNEVCIRWTLKRIKGARIKYTYNSSKYSKKYDKAAKQGIIEDIFPLKQL